MNVTAVGPWKSPHGLSGMTDVKETGGRYKKADALCLKEHVRREGITLVGVGDVGEALAPELSHLSRGIALAVDRGLGTKTVKILTRYQRLCEEWLSIRGFRSLSIPPDSDRRVDKCITKLYRLFSHKTAATCSGLGWIGKNGLIINKWYGSKLSWASVLTDAPLDVDTPILESQCGACELCVKHCPSGAVTGSIWTRRDPMKELVRYAQCRSLKSERRPFEGKPNCGLCITICPYSRKTKNVRTRTQGSCIKVA
jgi:epoxyqueuosine reductase